MSKKRKHMSDGEYDVGQGEIAKESKVVSEDKSGPSELRSAQKLEKLKNKYEKRGVVYISRLPPRMKPQKLRHMLEQHAPLGRLYLAPEDPLIRKKRKKRGGNSGKNFTEGWVEFEDKADAKRVAATLNGQPMGGRRRDAHYYDLWCMKYLPKFKWDHLTEEINYQKAIRDQKLAAELAAAQRERDFYLSRVDRAKAASAIAERRKKQKHPQDMEGDTGQAEVSEAGQNDNSLDTVADDSNIIDSKALTKGSHKLRTHGQRKPKPDPVEDTNAPKISRGVLEMIAGKKP